MSLKIAIYNSNRFELKEKRSWIIGKLRQKLAEQEAASITATDTLKRVEAALAAVQAEKDKLSAKLAELEK